MSKFTFNLLSWFQVIFLLVIKYELNPDRVCLQPTECRCTMISASVPVTPRLKAGPRTSSCCSRSWRWRRRLWPRLKYVSHYKYCSILEKTENELIMRSCVAYFFKDFMGFCSCQILKFALFLFIWVSKGPQFHLPTWSGPDVLVPDYRYYHHIVCF